MTGRPARSDGWRIEVTPDCVGSGMCLATAPGYFELVDGFSAPRNEVVSPHDVLVAAAELCPMSAIVVRDTTGHEVTSPGRASSRRSAG